MTTEQKRVCKSEHGEHSPELNWAECDTCGFEVFNKDDANAKLHLLCCGCLSAFGDRCRREGAIEEARNYRGALMRPFVRKRLLEAIGWRIAELEKEGKMEADWFRRLGT